MLEVCIDSLESALNAVHGGADELEVCSSLTEGGLTPSAGLVSEILQMVSKILQNEVIYKTCSTGCSCKQLGKKPKVNVMLRCRAGSDFCYSQEEMDTMLADVKFFKEMRVDRFVFGALNDTQDIDEEKCSIVISQAHPIPVTFHRAFDLCKNPVIAMEIIMNAGFNRVLTSGQRPSAGDYEAVKLIKTLIEMFGQDIEIMPGAGVNLQNAKTFVTIGCKIIHSSCKRVKHLPDIENKVNMGTNETERLYVTDTDTVRKLIEILKL